jgi:hypothetical protein
MRRPCCMFPKGISAFRAQTADDTPQCGPLPTRYGKGLIISTGEPTAGSRGSDEAAIFARELTLWVIRASLISQPTGRRSKGANLLFGRIPFQRIAELHVNPVIFWITLGYATILSALLDIFQATEPPFGSLNSNA